MVNELTFIPALRFHALTRVYDPVVRFTTREERIKRALVDGLGVAAPFILDVGSGTGTLLGLVAEKFPRSRLFGIDADPVMINLARKKLDPQVEIIHGDATELPFAPGMFDRVISSLVFHHLTREQKLAALRFIREALNDGGELHLADWAAPHDLMMRLAFLVVQLLDGFETTTDNVRGDIPRLMTEAGFTGVEETFRQRTPLGSMAIYKGKR